MIMGADNLVGLSFHGIFYTGVIIQFYQQWFYEGSVSMCIPGIGRMISMWDEVFFKLRVSFYGLVSRKKVFSYYSHRIETHLCVVV